jgi:hypothetical protein
LEFNIFYFKNEHIAFIFPQQKTFGSLEKKTHNMKNIQKNTLVFMWRKPLSVKVYRNHRSTLHSTSWGLYSHKALPLRFYPTSKVDALTSNC